MAKFKSNVDAAFTLKVDGKDKEFIITQGKNYELPDDNDYIKSLEASKMITPLEDKLSKKEQDEKEAEEKATEEAALKNDDGSLTEEAEADRIAREESGKSRSAGNFSKKNN